MAFLSYFYQEPIEVIQNNAPLGNSRYRQGVFKAKNPSKCMNLVVKNAKGELIYGPPKFRSSYELRFMTWADENEMVLIWGVEVCIVEYTSRIAIMEGKNPKRKYYVDFYVEIINPDGSVTKRLIEIKPKSQCSKPTEPKKKTQKSLNKYNDALIEWTTNEDKWKHACRFAQQNGMDFKVLHEGHLF